MEKASFIDCCVHDTWTHLTCQEQTASHEHGAMQPKHRRRRGLPSARDRRRQDRNSRAVSHWDWQQRNQHGHKLQCRLVHQGSIGCWRRRVRRYGLAFTHPLHTARHATRRRLHRHGTSETRSHKAKKIGRSKCDDDHDSEKAGVHVDVMRETAGSAPTTQENCPHPAEHPIRPKPSKNLLMSNQCQISHTFRKGLGGPGC